MFDRLFDHDGAKLGLSAAPDAHGDATRHARCADDRDLDRLLDREIAGAAKHALERHLGECRDCATRWRARHDARAWLRATEPLAPSAGFEARLAARIAETPRPVSWWRALLLAAVATSLGALTSWLGRDAAPAVPTAATFATAAAITATAPALLGPMRFDELRPTKSCFDLEPCHGTL